jgi:type VI secretion system secreted protein VgrG
MGNRTAEIKQGNDEITVGMGNRTVKVNSGKITEEAMQSIELKVGQNSVKIDQTGVTIKGLMIKIEGQTTTDLKGLTTTVSGDAMLTVKGGVVMIN